MKVLVAFGCSHTNGSMLDGKNGTSKYNVRNGFPSMIAKENGYDLINVSKPGGSNTFIHRSVIRFLNYNYNPDAQYVFLIGWTSPKRMELRYPDNPAYKHQTEGDYIDKKYVPFTAGSDPKLYKMQEMREMLNYSPLLFSDYLQVNNWTSYVLSLQKLLKARGIKYYMHNTCYEHEINDYNKDLVSHIDRHLYYKPFDRNHTMVFHNMNKGIEKTECWHFRHDGHREWANVLNEQMHIHQVL